MVHSPVAHIFFAKVMKSGGLPQRSHAINHGHCKEDKQQATFRACANPEKPQSGDGQRHEAVASTGI